MKNQKRTLISCAMLEDEVNHILEKTHLTLPVIWIDRGLHNRPENLNQLLQEHINQLQNQDEILLTFGLCGNGTAGLVSPNTMLRLPKFDDCINMLACRQPRTERKQTQKDALYLTRAGLWITKEFYNNIKCYLRHMMKRPVILSCRLSTTAIILLQSLIQDAMTCPPWNSMQIRLPHFLALTGKPFPEISQHWNI